MPQRREARGQGSTSLSSDPGRRSRPAAVWRAGRTSPRQRLSVAVAPGTESAGCGRHARCRARRWCLGRHGHQSAASFGVNGEEQSVRSRAPASRAPGFSKLRPAARSRPGSVAAPGRAEQAGDLGYGRYRLAGAMVLACLSSSQARCSAAVALLCSQRSPLSPARHCQARAWAIRFRAAASAGFPPQSSSWAEYVAAGIGVPSIPGSGRPASGRRVWDGIGVFSCAGGDRCGSLDGRQRSFAMDGAWP